MVDLARKLGKSVLVTVAFAVGLAFVVIMLPLLGVYELCIARGLDERVKCRNCGMPHRPWFRGRACGCFGDGAEDRVEEAGKMVLRSKSTNGEGRRLH